MNTCIKLFLSLCFAVAFAFGQAADTSKPVKQDTIFTLSGASLHQHIANIPPAKKTNWSRVKDLFL